MKQAQLLAVVVFLCAISVAFALPPGGGGGASQKTYRGFEGKITDENGKILKGVQITIVNADATTEEDVRQVSNSDSGKNLKTVSGNNGRYRFVAIRPGLYRVRFHIDGYQTLEKLMQFNRGSKDAMLNIQLKKLTEDAVAGGQ